VRKGASGGTNKSIKNMPRMSEVWSVTGVKRHCPKNAELKFAWSPAGLSLSDSVGKQYTKVAKGTGLRNSGSSIHRPRFGEPQDNEL